MACCIQDFKTKKRKTTQILGALADLRVDDNSRIVLTRKVCVPIRTMRRALTVM